MHLISNLRNAWKEIRWKMLVVFGFFSIVSMILIASFSCALLNIVIRRESAYLIEERIKVIVESRKKLLDPLLTRVGGCHASTGDSLRFGDFTQYLRALWPDTQTIESVVPANINRVPDPIWLRTDSFAGTVADQGSLDIRFFRTIRLPECSVTVIVRIPLGRPFLEPLSRAAGLEIASSKQEMLNSFHSHDGISDEIKANFIPGSRRPIPVVVIARNWQTGRFESWIVCKVRPSYSRTIEDLSRMGLRTAAWMLPLGGIALALTLVYAGGLIFSVRLSQRIVIVIEALSQAAHRIGKGDFSGILTISKQDQLGMLVSTFNDMTQDLEALREEAKQRIILEQDIASAHEAQRYLYPRTPPVVSGANVFGLTTPARIVSGDLYDFFTFSGKEVGLLCADVSGKGMSAALMMAHLQAVAHGRMLTVDKASARPSPDAFVTALNRDLRGRFGEHKYVTMFYGEFDSHRKVLRYINAGHCPPILISETGVVSRLTGGDLPVGLFPGITYQELQVPVSSGCSIVVYSDGVTDALNRHGEQFGEERVIACLTSVPKRANAKTICGALSERLIEWAANVEQFDDITILVLSVD